MKTKEQKIAELQGQVEILRTLPEGGVLPDGSTRVMIEKRRARYIAEAESCLATLKTLPESVVAGLKGNLLFHDDLMG